MDSVDTREAETTEVIICGGGPTGALLSALLGQMQVRNIVLEREADITTDPRGIALDEDGTRLLQAIGIYDKIFTRIALCQDVRFIGGAESDLSQPPFLVFEFTSSEGGTGHAGVIFHKQPELEKAIREVISLNSFSELRTSTELKSVAEDSRGVQVEYTNPQGVTKTLRAPFLVGADGKTGFVRKNYLEPRGILMERAKGTNYDETWVALNWQMRLPTPESHPDFPLWKLGYSPEQVYDLFFPEDFRFLCNPGRPSVCGRFGRPEDRLWRFEFVVSPSEDPEKMASQEEVAKIVYPYITHPGERYALENVARYPEDCISTLRAGPVRFEARSCGTWSLGRVALIGDAAHVFPPFGGQGIASGFRDAASLAWRLVHLSREPKTDHEELLRAWYVERKQQLEASLATTVHNGAILANANPWKAWTRDWLLWFLQLSPRMKRRLEAGPRVDGMIRYQHEHGLPFVFKYQGGLNLPQVYVRDLKTQKMAFSDDLVFDTSKRGLFQMLILVDRIEQAHTSLLQVQDLSERTDGRLRGDEATVLVHGPPIEHIDNDSFSVTVARIASGDEFAADPLLCRNRPAPKYYDPNRLQKELGRHVRYVVLRPDRFVYAACSNKEELWQALVPMRELLCLQYSAKL